MIAAQDAHASPSPKARPSAVVWIDGRRALVARMSMAGSLSTCEFQRGSLSDLEYLAQVVRLIGDQERVMIVGPGPDRLALEREYVSMYDRPDRLVDVEPAGTLGMDDLVARLRTLTA
jgi:hypothetical protein